MTTVPSASGARRAAGTVQVSLVLDRRVGVDDEGHIVDMDAARGDVRGDQHPGGTIRERRQVAGTGC